MGRSSLPDDLPDQRAGTSLDSGSGHRVNLPHLRVTAESARRSVSDDLYDYPGENPADGANLAQINHDHLVDDLFGLIDHLKIGRVFLVGSSFGSTIVLKALHREGRRFPRTAVQGAFAHRDFSRLERWALRWANWFRGRPSVYPSVEPC